jgi:hypothetical protein
MDQAIHGFCLFQCSWASLRLKIWAFGQVAFNSTAITAAGPESIRVKGTGGKQTTFTRLFDSRA